MNKLLRYRILFNFVNGFIHVCMTEIERNSLNLNEIKFVQINSYRKVSVVGFERSFLCLCVECSATVQHILYLGNTKGGSITIPLTSCLTGLDKSVFGNKNKNCQLSYS